VRSSCAADSKNAHLLALDGAEERLTLCRADVLNYDSLRAAFSGCHGVFHIASPVSNDPVSPQPLLCSLPEIFSLLRVSLTWLPAL
jgi:nucleoside-diphosphate-sugar epimerase